MAPGALEDLLEGDLARRAPCELLGLEPGFALLGQSAGLALVLDYLDVLTGLGRKNENGRSFDVALAMTLESDDERYAWANEALCIADATVVGRRVTMHVHRLVTRET